MIHIEPLNRYFVEMAKPKECIRNIEDYHGKGELTFKEKCDGCFFVSNDKQACVYKEVNIEFAHGDNYEQFCCLDCNAIVTMERRFHNEEYVCKQCGKPYVYAWWMKQKGDFIQLATTLTPEEKEAMRGEPPTRFSLIAEDIEDGR